MRNKATRAENQQERLIKIGWIVGFVDGEGCFSLGFVKQSNRQEKTRVRKGYRTGYQVFYEFAVTQGESSLQSLQLLKDFFGVGALYPNIRYDNHKENLYRYVVRRREDLQKIIIPFFQKYPLRTAKRKSFELFAKGLEEIEKGNHLTIKGIIRIAEISQRMNHKRDKSELIRILRNQTSDKRQNSAA
jgi:hypothetical protein